MGTGISGKHETPSGKWSDLASLDSQDDWQHACLISDALPHSPQMEVVHGPAPRAGLPEGAGCACLGLCLLYRLTNPLADGQPLPWEQLSPGGIGHLPTVPQLPPVFRLPSVHLPILWPPLSPSSNSEMPWQSSTPAGKGAASTSLSNQSTGSAGLAQAQGPAFSLAWWFAPAVLP